ncbi:Crp/Fnr family transcriptional regulator [Paenibacillus sp. ACRSA]|uniref:Crp/Fnr family transcriptional regulator n=1 Tax=Paenibacillus sp. ACRSA TaxID=2918211 RepID=UPI001EF6C161|nr:Crp/Fnr family transcriptional regulator [Paenibacillus sp. ACRSA]MCG7379197.1 Crp/Fnr family transcriptional regulator [Paenibacillus sp. ACRSA]
MGTVFIERATQATEREQTEGSKMTQRNTGGILSFVTAEQWASIETMMQPKRVKSGYSLFLEGDEAGYLYFIRSGRVKLTKSTEDGKEIILSIQQKGDLIGEFGGIGGQMHSYSAEMTDKGELAIISLSELESVLSKDGDLALKFLQWMALAQRITQSRFRDLLLYGKAGALASTLIRASNSYGKMTPDGIVLEMKLNHTELAEMIGATRESVTRMLGAWKEQGTLDTLEGKLIIRDLAALRCMCGCPTVPSCPTELCRM